MSDEEEKADVVDFDALHAALGDIPPPPTSSTPALAEATSGGKNNAQYASARPHTIPPTRAPVSDLNAPSIVIAEEMPPPSHPNMPAAAASNMTIPMGSPMLSGVGAVSPGPIPVAVRAPSASHPGFDGPRHPANDGAQQTMHMAGRPIAPPRRPRSPTMVVRTRGPSRAKKALVFIAMLLIVVGIGVAVLVFVRPGGIGIDGIPGLKHAPTFSPAPAPTLRRATTPVVAPTPVATPGAPAAATAGANGATQGSAAPLVPVIAPAEPPPGSAPSSAPPPPSEKPPTPAGE